jgi:hypothetical protein
LTRERWFGATGRTVPEIALDGTIELTDDVLVLDEAADRSALADAHAAGRPIVVRAATAEEVAAALVHPEVSCVLVPPERRDLLDLDLTELTYG